MLFCFWFQFGGEFCTHLMIRKHTHRHCWDNEHTSNTMASHLVQPLANPRAILVCSVYFFLDAKACLSTQTRWDTLYTAKRLFSEGFHPEWSVCADPYCINPYKPIWTNKSSTTFLQAYAGVHKHIRTNISHINRHKPTQPRQTEVNVKAYDIVT